MTTIQPSVSVIVPCYNQGKFLRDCLNSVVAQRFEDWECIVVDDGSTDNTREIAAEFVRSNPRIRYHYQSNAGLSGARNAGLLLANGPYVNFLDSDDLLLPSMLKTLFRIIQRQPDTDLVFSGYVAKDQSLTTTLRRVLPEFNFPTESFFDRLCLGNLFPVHAALVRKQCFESVGYFDVTLRSCEDWDMWLRVGRITNNIQSVKESLVVYRQSVGSMTRNVGTFFNMGMIVLERTVVADPRVLKPLSTYQGGSRHHYEEARHIWCLKCIGLYLAASDLRGALSLYGDHLKSKLEAGDILQIWKHLLSGAILLNRRGHAWKIYGGLFVEFVRLATGKEDVGQADILKRIHYFNASFPERLLLKLKR